MHCLSSASLRSLLPIWIQSLWIPSGEQSRERLVQTVPNASNTYTGTEPAVYKLQNTEVACKVTKPPPVCISNQIERAAETRANPPASDISTRPRAIDDYTDYETIVLPDIPPNIEFVKGRIICVEEEHLSPEWSNTRLKNKKLAVIMLSNVNQRPSSYQGL
ncbi:hypothetical protein N7489_005011 [Penicillium chrysogenum]|uniref:Uncharacterized protein n=1 Tax=Penicillium chrysogenum TaxID=5076 RepID=A0ABQ8WEZ5_PENCH|nr:uncharacterized protein N7489_005011 [Penicillium chrysogenum]KAJ5244915.1 hypothetical protein N7489_005011 [Penicillium chrysogenum]KAJ5264718.1 hypothetical protein N7505_007511 [Penicillium chrysogenum]KAJ5849202.1 hypothetical protein N7534_007891 [Penicillium rubens]